MSIVLFRPSLAFDLILDPSFKMTEARDFLCKKDKALRVIIEKYGHPIIQNREEGFQSMCHIILEQQVSIASAQACFAKLQNQFDVLSPKNIANATDDAIRKCGISRQKCIYLKDLANNVLSKTLDFESFRFKTETQIRDELVKVKGVGNWSIEVYLMFCLQQPDIFPLGDIAIKNTMKELYQTETVDEMIALSDTWKPFRTFATYTLWHYYLSKRNRI